MSLTLPPVMAELLRELGFRWPEADEDLLWECANSWKAFAATLRDASEAAGKTVQSVTEHNAEDSIEAFALRWKEFDDDPGYLKNSIEAAELAGMLFAAAATIVIALKVAVLAQLFGLAAATVMTFGAGALAVRLAAQKAIGAAVRFALDRLREAGERLAMQVRERLKSSIKRLKKRPGQTADTASAPPTPDPDPSPDPPRSPDARKPSERFFDPHSVPSATKLGENLEAAGMPKKPGQAAHHIVPGTESRYPGTMEARELLKKFEIDINDADNGIWLPHDKRSPNPDSELLHLPIHTKEYYAKVADLLAKATNQEEAVEVLHHIRRQLDDKKWPPSTWDPVGASPRN